MQIPSYTCYTYFFNLKQTTSISLNVYPIFEHTQSVPPRSMTETQGQQIHLYVSGDIRCALQQSANTCCPFTTFILQKEGSDDS